MIGIIISGIMIKFIKSLLIILAILRTMISFLKRDIIRNEDIEFIRGKN